jgi:hypothetical protein
VTRESFVRVDPIQASADPDAAVLCAAFGGLGQWVGDWDKRIVVVFDDVPGRPEFPWTETQAALAAAHDPKFDPFAPPFPGEDLVIADGPVIPATLVSSALSRWKSVKALPPPNCENVIVADGERLNQLWKADIPAGWKKFWALFPDSSGVVRCSAPGYDAAGREAIVSCSHTKGALNGVGVFFVIAKEEQIWRVNWSKSMWVS